MSCGVVYRRSWDLAWLWLWCRLVVTAPIRPLAWEPPYATGVALKRQKKIHPKKKRKVLWSSCHGAAEANPTRNHEVVGSIPGLAQWVKDLVLS